MLAIGSCGDTLEGGDDGGGSKGTAKCRSQDAMENIGLGFFFPIASAELENAIVSKQISHKLLRQIFDAFDWFSIFMAVPDPWNLSVERGFK